MFLFIPSDIGVLLVVVVVITRPLPRDGGMAEDHGAPEAEPPPGSKPEVVKR